MWYTTHQLKGYTDTHGISAGRDGAPGSSLETKTFPDGQVSWPTRAAGCRSDVNQAHARCQRRTSGFQRQRAGCPKVETGPGVRLFIFGDRKGMRMEKATVLHSVRLTPSDLMTLRKLAGPRGGSKLVRALIRAEAARRDIFAGKDRSHEGTLQAR